MITTPSLYIVDDNIDLLQSFEQLFFTLDIPCKTFASAKELLAQWLPENRGCLLIDMRMPGVGGIELQTQLTRLGSCPPVIFMSGYCSIQSVVQAMKKGALDVLQKPFDQDRLIGAVREAFALDEAQFEARHARQAFLRRMTALTGRERQVVDYMVSGASNKEIARGLDISPRTVETHRAHVIQKLDVKSLAELVKKTTPFGRLPA